MLNCCLWLGLVASINPTDCILSRLFLWYSICKVANNTCSLCKMLLVLAQHKEGNESSHHLLPQHFNQSSFRASSKYKHKNTVCLHLYDSVICKHLEPDEIQHQGVGVHRSMSKYVNASGLERFGHGRLIPRHSHICTQKLKLQAHSGQKHTRICSHVGPIADGSVYTQRGKAVTIVL